MQSNHLPICRCMVCGQSKFKSIRAYLRHAKKHIDPEFYPCPLCCERFNAHKKLEVHINTEHRCPYCRYEDEDHDELCEHIRSCQSKSVQQIGTGKSRRRRKRKINQHFDEIKAFEGFNRTYRHRMSHREKHVISVEDYFHRYGHNVKSILRTDLDDYKSIKVQVSVLCRFTRENQFEPHARKEICDHFANSNMKVILNKFYVNDVLLDMQSQISTKVQLFEVNGSGWVLERVKGSDIRIAEFELFRGGCMVDIPNHLKEKRAIVNIRCSGEECFVWAFLSMLHYNDLPGNNPRRERYTQYRQFHDFYDFHSLSFPTGLQQIRHFETKNQDKGFAVNVFGIDDRNIINLKYQSLFIRDSNRTIVNLLYVQSNVSHPGHYMGISSISRLLGKANSHAKSLCYNCLSTFADKEKLIKHQKLCYNFKTQRITMPVTGRGGKPPVCKFKNYHHKLKVRFAVYCDFEAICVRQEEKVTESYLNYAKHIPSGYSYVVVADNEVIRHKVHRSRDAMNHFAKEISAVCMNLNDLNLRKLPMQPLSADEKQNFRSSRFCHICVDEVDPSLKVADHCHVTGVYRGVAHRHCNAEFHQGSKIPIVIHNAKNYDIQLLLSHVSEISKGKVTVLPQNSEKFISISTPDYYIIDSFLHLSASLDTLVSDLAGNTDKNKKGFKLLGDVFGKRKGMDLVRKGVYPYEYMDDWSKFELTSFPSRSEFFNSITGEMVSDSDYSYGRNIFQKYCKTLGEYHDLYLLTDTVLPACVFEKFREIAMTNYQLDPLHYLTLASYAWDSALLITNQKLELLTDQDMYNTIESGIRGGVSMISTRYAKAKNKYLRVDRKEKADDTYIIYIDKCNLYGECLCAPLPVGDWRWETKGFSSRITAKQVMNWDDFSATGRILTVDLDYPPTLHDQHNEYPLAPEKISISEQMLSQYQRNLISHYDMKYQDKQKKLVPHLGSRRMYVVHYRVLKFYLQKGMVLRKVHSCIRFRQQAWLKGYVELNGNLRKMATTDFEKNLYKFMVNSVFGKSMQNVRNMVEGRIVSNISDMKRLTCNSNFKGFQILNPSLVIVFLEKSSAELNRPIYTAMTCLDNAKLFMYQWHYDKIKNWYGQRAKFLFTDTDSLAYIIETRDVYRDFERHADEFDFSGYNKNHFLYSEKNKKVIGKMTDEAQGNVIRSFVGVAPKMYSFRGKNVDKKACKGVKRSIVRKHITHSVFKTVLMKQKKVHATMNLIRSKKHHLHSVNVRKVALHCFESKRYILGNGIDTLAHSNYRITN